MEHGMLYDANYDEALCEERRQCKDKCFAFNHTLPSDIKKQEEILKGLLGRFGEDCDINAPFYADYGRNIFFGDHVHINHNCVILDGAKVTFGDNVFVAPNCMISTAGHALDVEKRNRGIEYAYPVTIGDNVWIGANVTILPGVSIGSGSVIAAGSVVNRDIPEGVVAAGVPCRVIHEITEEDGEKYGKYEG